MPDETIGQRLRRYRRACGKTLVEVANEAGLSAGFLSQAERDITGMSLSSLANIAQAIGVSASDLFESPQQNTPDSHANTRQSYSAANMPQRYERLSSTHSSSVLNAVKLTLPPGYHSETVAHTGDEFVYVLSGEVIYQVDGKDFALSAGDSLHFDPQQKHSIRNDSKQNTEVISVGTLALFTSDKSQKS